MEGFDALAPLPKIRDEGRNAQDIYVKMRGKVYPGVYVPDYSYSVGILAYETGHALGLDHTFGNSPGSGRWDIMGRGASGGNRHLRFGAIPGDENAYHKMKKGWIKPEQIMRLEPGMEKEFHLERIAEPTQPRYLAAVIAPANAGRLYWTLEARIRAGYDMGSIPKEGVVCFQCDPERQVATTPWFDGGPFIPSVSGTIDDIVSPDEGLAAWEVGKTYTNAQYHFAVTVVSRDATGYTVRVKVDR